MALWLSPNFSLEELTATQQRKLDNTPPVEVVAVLRRTAERMEGVRRLLGDHVISVNSGYRSPAVNRAVGGAKTSHHLTGHAVDFTCDGFGDPRSICGAIAGAKLIFDQLIDEGRWVHIGFAPQARRQILTKTGGGYVRGLR